MKTLVAIANFGTKNDKYLNRLLEEYRSMTRYQVDVVVLSNIPKNLGSGIKVVVGLPTKDPWSLPFGHKSLFAERMGQYDLFIYSEDDTLITERNIDAFIRVTRVLPDKYIAGFIRYEISESGKKYYSTLHTHYHWDPNSVLKIGDYIFAHYTNEHSACFIMTQNQLKRAIDSGGFLLPPGKRRYDMLVTAATDPYTQCGMKKFICISHLEDFCLHHLPNVYCGKIGLDTEWADREIERLKSLCGTETIRGPLFDTETKLEDHTWDKKYYEPCRKDILSLIPKGVKRVLSVGCGCGSTESELVKKGIEVVGIPLDCVIQVTAAAKGVKIVPPSFEAAMETLQGGYFDCILFQDILHHLPDPVQVLNNFIKLLDGNGYIVISTPNFNSLSIIRWILREYGIRYVLRRRPYEAIGLHVATRGKAKYWLQRSDLGKIYFMNHINSRFRSVSRLTYGMFDELFSKNVLVIAKRY